MAAQAQPVPDAAKLFTQHSMPAFADIRASRVETAGAKDLPAKPVGKYNVWNKISRSEGVPHCISFLTWPPQ